MEEDGNVGECMGMGRRKRGWDKGRGGGEERDGRSTNGEGNGENRASRVRYSQ